MGYFARHPVPGALLVAVLTPQLVAAQVTARVNVSSSGAQAALDSYRHSISADGRFVAFESLAGNLISGDTNGTADVFVRDRLLGTTERISIDSSGAQGTGASQNPSISADGRYVAFESTSGLAPPDTNALMDIYVRDRQLGSTECVSVAPVGTAANNYSQSASISSDGRYVAFESEASNLVVGGDTNGALDVFVRDRQLGTTERVSVGPGGVQGNGDCSRSSLSSDGQRVIFDSIATNLVAGDTNGFQDVFVRDRQLGTTERVSIGLGGAQANDSSYGFAISPDGRFVALTSLANNLVPGDTNVVGYDVFLRDRMVGTNERVNVDSGGAQANGSSIGRSMSPDVRFVSFQSDADDLVPGDTNSRSDIFLRDRLGAPDFTSVCDPGLAGVIACPCANPPSGPGRGCDNSSSTGGAVLSASGGTYLSSDSLVLTTSGQRPTALSIVAQWIGGNASGVVFGMGVRCTSGTFKRLYSRNAVGGSITVPDFGAGDPSVSAQSALKGDTILPGQSRWYVVYYRDPNVLGGCPATSNFNATQTGIVAWAP